MIALAVFAGGGIGALLRWLIGAAIGPAGFPVATLSVNLIGGFLIGAASARIGDDPFLRALIMTGLLGGFTTFSAFSLDVVDLLDRGRWLAAALYVAVSVPGAIAAAAAGWQIAQRAV